jgi:hypothetical protein
MNINVVQRNSFLKKIKNYIDYEEDSKTVALAFYDKLMYVPVPTVCKPTTNASPSPAAAASVCFGHEPMSGAALLFAKAAPP